MLAYTYVSTQIYPASKYKCSLTSTSNEKAPESFTFLYLSALAKMGAYMQY